MIKLFVCKICGEPYLGGEKPSECAFCGAATNYIGIAEDYSVLWGVELSDQEKQDMEKTLGLEVNATAYYTDVFSKHPKYSKYNRLYKQLMRVEKEHAEVAAKFLGIELPEFKGESSRGSIEEDLKRTVELETDATALYKKFTQNATNEKVKLFFSALAGVEQGHIDHASAELGA